MREFLLHRPHAGVTLLASQDLSWEQEHVSKIENMMSEIIPKYGCA